MLYLLVSTIGIVHKRKKNLNKCLTKHWGGPEKQTIHEALKSKNQFVIDHQFHSPLSRQIGFATNCSLFMMCELCECILASFPVSTSAQIKVKTLTADSDPCVGWHHPSKQNEKGKSGCCHRRALPLAQFGLFNGIYRLLLSRCFSGGGSSSEALVILLLSWRMSSMKEDDLTGNPQGLRPIRLIGLHQFKWNWFLFFITGKCSYFAN